MTATNGPTESFIRITYEDGRVVQLPDTGSSLLHLAGTGALDVLINAVEPLRQDPKEET